MYQEIFGDEFTKYAGQVHCVANEIQLNVQAESDAITKYNNMKAVIESAELLERDLRDEINGKLDGIIAEEMKHINILQELNTLLTGIVAEDD